MITPFGAFKMLVAPQGYLQSPQVYQDRIVSEVLHGMHGSSCVNWIDDCLLFGRSEPEYLQRLDDILGRYAAKKVKLSFAKCNFYSKAVIWCGREISAKGVRFSPDYYDSVLTTREPDTAAELHDFLFAFNWLSSTLNPQIFLEARAKLWDVLNDVFNDINSARRAATRKRKALIGKRLADYGWSEAHSSAFRNLLRAVRDAVHLAVIDPSKHLCLFTDACDIGASIVLTQTEDLSLDFGAQKHEIVHIHTMSFTGSSVRWHVSCKEAYPIMYAFKKLQFLLGGRKVNIFTDHRNLAHIFAPTAVGKATAGRLSRWAILLQANHYVVRHISGFC